ncbi:hypothetical protein ACNQFZ_13370 [Schinkia sp. CFF1]
MSTFWHIADKRGARVWTIVHILAYCRQTKGKSMNHCPHFGILQTNERQEQGSLSTIWHIAVKQRVRATISVRILAYCRQTKGKSKDHCLHSGILQTNKRQEQGSLSSFWHIADK